MVQAPRLLNADLTERERLHPNAATLNLVLKGASDATITLSDDGPEVAVHDWVGLYTQRGFNGIYRVSNVTRSIRQQTEITLLHGIDVLHDSVWQAQIEFDGTVETFLDALLSQQTQLVNGVRPWVLGVCEDHSPYKKSINYDDLFDLLNEMVEDGGEYYFSYDQSSFPWTVNLVSRGTEPQSEFRLTRNMRAASVTYNDADLCTRLILSDNHKSKNGGVSTNKRALLTYDNPAAQAVWGVVIKTADIDTEDDIEHEDYSEANEWARSFLARRA